MSTTAAIIVVVLYLLAIAILIGLYIRIGIQSDRRQKEADAKWLELRAKYKAGQEAWEAQNRELNRLFNEFGKYKRLKNDGK